MQAPFPTGRTIAFVGLLAVLPWHLAIGGDEVTKAYPQIFKAPKAPVESIEAPAGTHKAWRTRHFELLSDQDIDRDALGRLATTMESLPGLLEKHPFPLLSPLEKGRTVIRLCRDAERFSEFGGPTNSAGFFNLRSNEILIRADLFLTPPGGSARLKSPPDEGLLIHEVCHFAMAGALLGSKPWLKEGLAEYFSVAHERNGIYRFNQYERAIPKHLYRHLGRQTGDELTLPSIERTLSLDDREWSRLVSDSNIEERYLPYATALLFVHYQIEGGAARRVELNEFVTELGKPRSRRDPRPEFKLKGPKTIENRLVSYWSARGLKLRFE